MQEQYDVIVVGGGAAGMFAAIHVGLAGKRVQLHWSARPPGEEAADHRQGPGAM